MIEKLKNFKQHHEDPLEKELQRAYDKIEEQLAPEIAAVKKTLTSLEKAKALSDQYQTRETAKKAESVTLRAQISDKILEDASGLIGKRSSILAEVLVLDDCLADLGENKIPHLQNQLDEARKNYQLKANRLVQDLAASFQRRIFDKVAEMGELIDSFDEHRTAFFGAREAFIDKKLLMEQEIRLQLRFPCIGPEMRPAEIPGRIAREAL